MSSISIREATLEDASEIALVNIQAWQQSHRGNIPQDFLDSLDINEWTENWKTRLIHPKPNIFVALLDGKICGYIRGGPIAQPVQGFDAELYAINIVNFAKGKGIGRRLIGKLAERLRGLGFKNLVLWVLAGNSPARKFYEHLGAVDLKQQKILENDGPHRLGVVEVAYGWRDIGLL